MAPVGASTVAAMIDWRSLVANDIPRLPTADPWSVTPASLQAIAFGLVARSSRSSRRLLGSPTNEASSVGSGAPFDA